MLQVDSFLRAESEGTFEPAYGYALFLHRGLAYSEFASRRFADLLEDFPVSEDDVFLVGFPKSGTNWLDVVVAHLYDHWQSTRISRNGIVPEISIPNLPDVGLDGLETCLASATPRLMKSHQPATHLPRAFREGKGRAICIVRNPKDVCDSFFNQLSGKLTFDWPLFVDAFAAGKVPFGPWLDNVLSWYDPALDGRVLRLTYEGMRRDPRGAVDQITAFLGPVDQARIDQVLRDTDFQAMQTNQLADQYQPIMKRRQGGIGGWKDKFTVAASDLFDEIFDKPLRERGIVLSYE